MDNSDVTALILVNGGRWLLTASDLESVSYYDLDARQWPVKTLLIHEQIEYLPGFRHFESMDLDICITNPLCYHSILSCIHREVVHLVYSTEFLILISHL